MKTIKTLTAIALTAVLAFAFAGCSQDAGDSLMSMRLPRSGQAARHTTGVRLPAGMM